MAENKQSSSAMEDTDCHNPQNKSIKWSKYREPPQYSTESSASSSEEDDKNVFPFEDRHLTQEITTETGAKYTIPVEETGQDVEIPADGETMDVRHRDTGSSQEQFHQNDQFLDQSSLIEQRVRRDMEKIRGFTTRSNVASQEKKSYPQHGDEFLLACLIFSFFLFIIACLMYMRN